MNSIGRKSLIACAVATALGSGAAIAVPPTTTPDIVLYAAGGSAQANAFFTAMNTLMNSVSSYSDATGCADSGSYRVVFGSLKAAAVANGATIAAGKNILYFYKFNGGSFPNGVNPQVGAGVTLAYPNTLTIIPGTTTFPLPVAETCTNAGAPNYTFSDTNQLTNTQIPDWGVADVEVGLFSGYNNSSGTCAGASTSINCQGPNAPTVGKSTGIYDNLFGVATTHSVFTGTGPAAGHPKTNFTRAEMVGILSGQTSDWSQLYDDNGARMPAQKMILIDRGQGSGTKASGNQYFLGYPGGGSAAVLPGSAVFGYTGTSLQNSNIYQDIAESSTTNIINDLINAQNDNLMAVAVLGLENPPALHQAGGSTNLYDFTKINGIGVDTGGASDNVNGTVATTYVNAVTGAYDFFYQNSFNTRANFLAGTGNGAIMANVVQSTMQAAAFVGPNDSQAFPNSVNGTLQDADNLAAPIKGGGMVSRKKVSPASLQPVFDAHTAGATAGVPLGSDPL